VNRNQVGLPARRMAVRVLTSVLVDGHPLDEVLERLNAGVLASFAERDRGFVRAIASTTLRRLGQIDAALAAFMDKPLPKGAGPAREILRTAAAQLLFMDGKPHAVIDLAVRLAAEDRRARAFKAVVNAVLRRVAEEGPAVIAGQDAAALDVPAWLWRRWSDRYGEATTRAIAAMHLEEPALDLTVKADPGRWAEALGGRVLPNGSVRIPAGGRIEAHEGFAAGDWWIQDAAASLPARLLGDVAGKRVLDLCAAPGGKTAQLAAAGAIVTAVDRSPQRIARLEGNLARLGLAATTVVADALDFTADDPYDAILLDAPCTATGTIRRHPDIPWLKSPDAIADMAAAQGRLLRHAVDLLAPGGRLVYCTCSLEPEEGEEQIARLIANGAPVERVAIDPATIGAPAEAAAADGDLRTLPCHWPAREPRMGGLDGFFISVLINCP
jgi:16S rRNA (cytosine967-C5)-methyltransferase